jgi:hypothetical protein
VEKPKAELGWKDTSVILLVMAAVFAIWGPVTGFLILLGIVLLALVIIHPAISLLLLILGLGR